MNIKKKLLNPFALIGEGFLAGALVFYAVPGEPPAQPLTTTVQSGAAQQIAGI